MRTYSTKHRSSTTRSKPPPSISYTSKLTPTIRVPDARLILTPSDRFKKAEIIPTVIDSFKPLLTVNVTWPDASAEYGNTINPDKTQKQPQVTLYDALPGGIWSSSKTPQLTLALTDPDAPSRDNPEWSEICHWIVTEIKLSDFQSEATVSRDLQEIMPYKPPGPPPKTGKHRYVFVALAPLNGTTETLHLERPGDRQHWGYEKERQGLRIWAEENGLGVVGKYWRVLVIELRADETPQEQTSSTSGTMSSRGQHKFNAKQPRCVPRRNGRLPQQIVVVLHAQYPCVPLRKQVSRDGAAHSW